MISFPNAKINLGLHITGKRSGGYHDIETVFYPVSFYDVLELLPKHRLPVQVRENSFSNDNISFLKTGIEIPGDVKDNLCIRAYDLLSKEFPSIPPVFMHLHKAIPAGSGLGGGSSDAAFTLQLLNVTFNLEIPTNRMMDYASQLGSDCPFFIINNPCFATGRGEVLEQIPVDLSGYLIILVIPKISVNTAWAYSQVNPSDRVKPLKELIMQPVETWKGELNNDFEEPLFIQMSGLQEIREKLYEHGAIYASLTGSGSCIYGIFKKNSTLSIIFEKGIQVIRIK